MKALCWTGINKLQVETVDDPSILNDHDVIELAGVKMEFFFKNG